MKVKPIPQNNLTAALAILSPYVPELSPAALVGALRNHDTNPSRDLPRYLNKHQFAEMAGVTWWTAVEWAKAGTVPARKIGGQWRFPADALEKAHSRRQENDTETSNTEYHAAEPGGDQ